MYSFRTGQIELYSHLPVMRNVVDQLQKTGYRVCAVYLLDSVFIRCGHMLDVIIYSHF